MKNHLMSLLVITTMAACLTGPARALSLHDRYSPDQLKQMFAGVDNWKPFPRYSDRDAWSKVDPRVADYFLAKAREAMATEIPALPATLYLQYRRNGNRSNYEHVWFQRRSMLHILVIAECIEGKGQFLDRIADLVWAICEESAWTFPAHVGAQKAGTGLPDVDDQVVALFSAETGSSMAWTQYLLGDQLAKVSPRIPERIDREINRRILVPYMEKNFGWMGFGRGGRPNNWNPWINSNMLAVTMLSEKDPDKRMALLDKILRSIDNFLEPYPTDGSCDEGPSYWGHAGASLFDDLEWLYLASGGKFDCYNEPIIKEIGRFIYRANICGDYFANVGDCDGRVHIYRDVVWRFGKRIGDEKMQQLAACGATVENIYSIRFMGRMLEAVFTGPEVLAAAKNARQPLLGDVWLGNKDMQLMAARDVDGDSKGLYVAAWGAHNGQSHNHNDVGNFIIFADGKPVIIDGGRPAYTRQTFSSQRYGIWLMRSEYHNCPTINGVQQGAGSQYAARDVVYDKGADFAQLTMDLSDAYPKSAKIDKWQRTVRLNRGNDVVVTDDFRLSQRTGDVVLNLMTACQVSLPRAGVILFDYAPGKVVTATYDADKLKANTEEYELDDEGLREVWGPKLRRIQLTADNKTASEKLTLTFSKGGK